MREYSLLAALERNPELNRRPVHVARLRDEFDGEAAGSLRSLLIRLGPFLVEDAFAFGNAYELTAGQLIQLSALVGEAQEAVVDEALGIVRNALESLSVPIPIVPDVSLPDFVIDAVLAPTKPLIALGVGGLIRSMLDVTLPGGSEYGRCGGMAFAAYDLYQQGRPPDPNQTDTPQDGPLADYIFDRLIDSLALNGRKFMEWMVDLHVMPAVGGPVTSTLLNVAAGPVGAGLAALIGGSPDIFNFGGRASLLRRTRQEWTAIKRVLDAEPACPIGLIFANNRNPLDQHQVLAVAYTDDPNAGPPTLDVWDNKRPHSSGLRTIDTVTLDFSGDELGDGGGPEGAGFKGVVAGFFREDYTPRVPPAF